MPLWISENDIESVLEKSAPELFARLDAVYCDDRGWDVRPRTRHMASSANFQYMGAVVPSENVMGLKTYVGRSKVGFEGVVVLFDEESGELLSVMGCDVLGRWRTGIASALAAKYLAKPGVVNFGLIGAGKQAMTQLAALRVVREVSEVRVYSRDPSHREALCREVSVKFGITAIPTDTAKEVVKHSDVVATVTPAREVVLHGSWLQRPCLVNAVGANWPNQRELDSEAFRRASLVVVDDLEQAKLECGDLIAAIQDGVISWDDVISLKAAIGHNLSSVVAGEVTVFESQGLAVWDLVAARLAYEHCLASGLGITVPLWVA